MFKRYLGFWRDAFDFRGGAYRLDYWWISVINALILALILFITLGLGRSWTLASIFGSAFGLVSFVPNLSLTVRRLRDTGMSARGMALFFMSPTLLGLVGSALAGLQLGRFAPIAWLIYTLGILFVISRRSAYWTPFLPGKVKIAYAFGFVIAIILTVGLNVWTFQQAIGDAFTNLTKQPAQSAQPAQQSATSSSASSTSKTVDDTDQVSAYQKLPETTIGDSDFGYFKVRGTWQQDTQSLQWWQMPQNVMILTSTMGQGWGVDFTSFPFKETMDQRAFVLRHFASVKAFRIDGTYQDPQTGKDEAMTYLEWHMPDGHIRVVYIIAQTRPLVDAVVTTLGATFDTNE
ncbi:MAG TPA: DUF805 domain-containing protein [Lactobacillaceae bacterium]|jgi:uncharacterized membrane protein YhaH (DUF805 family)